MSNKITCFRCYVNNIKFTENNDDESKSRLNLTLGSTLVGNKNKEKFYVNYNITLWGKQAVKYKDVLQTGKDGGNPSVVSFTGEWKEYQISEYKDKAYLYLTIDVGIFDFTVVGENNNDEPPSEKKTEKKVSKQSKLEDEDDI